MQPTLLTCQSWSTRLIACASLVNLAAGSSGKWSSLAFAMMSRGTLLVGGSAPRLLHAGALTGAQFARRHVLADKLLVHETLPPAALQLLISLLVELGADEQKTSEAQHAALRLIQVGFTACRRQLAE